ncbi:hypothetical protein [Natronorarus salvus]|uniref:hypothetical protein n=1 Tax=Natronorarus salvus TaxID=3117733 RepID=UPI002F26D534
MSSGRLDRLPSREARPDEGIGSRKETDGYAAWNESRDPDAAYEPRRGVDASRRPGDVARPVAGDGTEPSPGWKRTLRLSLLAGVHTLAVIGSTVVSLAAVGWVAGEPFSFVAAAETLYVLTVAGGAEPALTLSRTYLLLSLALPFVVAIVCFAHLSTRFE